MKIIETPIADAFIIEPAVHGDHRGFFLETYSQKAFAEAGLNYTFIQDNHSKSAAKGVLRGLHFQRPPMAQTKLVRVIRGAVYDAIVDLRKSSPSFGKWFGVELSAENFKMFLVPRGCAHGFCTLVDNTEFTYKVDSLYSPTHEHGIMWNDPELSIPWPVAEPVLSARDTTFGRFSELVSPF